MRTFASLATMPLGFDRDPVLLVELDVQRSQVPQERRADLYARLAEAAAACSRRRTGGDVVADAGERQGWNNAFDIPGKPNLSIRQRLAFINAMTPGWHSVYGTRLVAGREFTDGRSRGQRRRWRSSTRPTSRSSCLPATRWARSCSSRRADWRWTAAARDGDRRGGRGRRVPRSARADAAHGLSADGATAGRRRVSQRRCQRARRRLARRRCSCGALSEALSAVDPDVSLSFRPLKDQVDARLVRERVLALLGGFFGAPGVVACRRRASTA